MGFIVFNQLTYPNLINFFKELNVPFEKSDMSFAVSVQDSDIEYGGKGLNTFFAKRSNIFNFSFLKMFFEIIFFYKNSSTLIKQNLKDISLGRYLENSKLSKYFINYHIIPMVAAIWSMPFEKAKDLPLKLFLDFFINHGLFKFKERPQWYTVTNRSKAYVDKVLPKISGEIFKNYKVEKIIRNDDNVRIFFGNEHLDYDQVILASHADQALDMIKDTTEDEKRILGKFKYVSNLAVLHKDSSLMPKRKLTWSSWNSITKGNKTCVTYWLNNLQNLKCENNYFLTLNPIYEIDKRDIIKNVNFTHPFFNSTTTKLQKELILLQGKKELGFVEVILVMDFMRMESNRQKNY